MGFLLTNHKWKMIVEQRNVREQDPQRDIVVPQYLSCRKWKGPESRRGTKTHSPLERVCWSTWAVIEGDFCLHLTVRVYLPSQLIVQQKSHEYDVCWSEEVPQQARVPALLRQVWGFQAYPSNHLLMCYYFRLSNPLGMGNISMSMSRVLCIYFKCPVPQGSWH
jgi:hypothetical protein